MFYVKYILYTIISIPLLLFQAISARMSAFRYSLLAATDALSYDEFFHLSPCANLEMKALMFLQQVYDFEQVVRLWVALGTEHAHETFGRFVGEAAKPLKTYCGIDGVAQSRFYSVHVTGAGTRRLLLAAPHGRTA